MGVTDLMNMISKQFLSARLGSFCSSGSVQVSAFPFSPAGPAVATAAPRFGGKENMPTEGK